MAQLQEIAVVARKGTGKGPSYQTRKTGHIPAIVYGGGTDPEPVSLDVATITKYIDRGAFLTTLFVLNEDGKKTRVIPRALQRDPVSDRPIHVDFMRLGEGAMVRLAIPVKFRGHEASPGLKRGGVLNIVRHKIELVCPAEHIPEVIVIDLKGLDINDSVHLDNIQLPPGARPALHGHDTTLASIVAPSGMAEEVAKTAEAAPAAAAAAPAAAAKAPAAKAPAAKDAGKK